MLKLRTEVDDSDLQDKKYTKDAWNIFEAHIFENLENTEPQEIFIVLIRISTKKVLIDVTQVVAKTIHHSRHLLGRFQKATDIIVIGNFLPSRWTANKLSSTYRSVNGRSSTGFVIGIHLSLNTEKGKQHKLESFYILEFISCIIDALFCNIGIILIFMRACMKKDHIEFLDSVEIQQQRSNNLQQVFNINHVTTRRARVEYRFDRDHVAEYSLPQHWYLSSRSGEEERPMYRTNQGNVHLAYLIGQIFGGLKRRKSGFLPKILSAEI